MVATISLLALALTLTLVPLAGCSPQSRAQSPAATVSAQATQVQVQAATITPTIAIALTTPTVVATTSITATAVVTPAGTAGVRPTPSGEAPDPVSMLNVFQFFPPNDTLVSRDLLDLDGAGTGEVFFTISGSRFPITAEVQSGLGVLSYDATYREWVPLWATPPLTGTASPLPAANRKEAGGYNGGNILGNVGPILAARTTSVDGRAYLYLWRWDKAAKEGKPLKMALDAGGEKDAVFSADLDANLADLDDDGVYEVVLDNLASVQIWRWDGARFVPRGGR